MKKAIGLPLWPKTKKPWGLRGHPWLIPIMGHALWAPDLKIKVEEAKKPFHNFSLLIEIFKTYSKKKVKKNREGEVTLQKV
jgi:hypothetical protein